MIVFVSLNASLSIFNIKIKLSQLLQNEFIDWNTMIAYNDATIERNITNLFTPIMLENLLNSVSLCRINIEDFL